MVVDIEKYEGHCKKMTTPKTLPTTSQIKKQ